MERKYMMIGLGNPVFDIIETPYVRTDGRVLSGCSVNAALTIGKLGGSAIVVGAVGVDYKSLFLSKLSEYGVDAYPLDSKETGGFYLKYLDERMDDRILRVIGHADRISVDDVPTRLLGNADSILVGPILDEIDTSLVRYLSRSFSGILVVDPQGFVRRRNGDIIERVANPQIREIISLSDVFKPNEHEAHVIFGSVDPVRVAYRITKLGAKIGIVTLAERGSVISFGGKTYRIPAYTTRMRDPTGCGDVYAGGFIYHYLKTEDPVESAAFASAVASFMVESVGPDFMLDGEAVMERFGWIMKRVRRVD